MQKFFFFLFLCIYSLAHAQNNDAAIDDFAADFKCRGCDLEEHTKKLTAAYTTDKDKARVIFSWVAHSVRYDWAKFEKGNNKIHVEGKDKAEVAAKLLEYKEETVPNHTFKSRKGVCEDYSRLYQKMCTIAGVECLTISGVSKFISKKISNTGHAWNVVKLDNQWQLLDVTWGAGYVDDGKFHYRYSPGYFMASPRFFILNHLPKEDKWQMQPTILTRQQFSRQPWLNYGQNAYPILDVQPLEDAIKKEKDKAIIRIKFKTIPPVLRVTSAAHAKLPFTLSQKDGYTIITVTPKSGYEILLFAGETEEEELIGLAKFYID